MIKSRRFISLKVKILLLTLMCIILSLLFFIAATVSIAPRELRTQARDNIASMTELMRQNLEREYESIQTVADYMTSHVMIEFDAKKADESPRTYLPAYMEEISPHLLELAKNSQGTVGLYVVFNVDRYDGVYEIWYVLNNGTWQTHEPEDRSLFHPDNENLVWYYQPILKGKPVWTDLYFDLLLKEDCFSYVVPVIVQGKVIAVAGLDASFSTMKDSLTTINTFKSSKAILIDKAYSPIVDPGLDNRSLEEIIGPMKSRASEAKGVYETHDYLVSFSRLSNGQILIVLTTKSEIDKPVNNVLRTSVFFGICLLATLLILGYWFAEGFTSKLTKLGDYAREATSGNLDMNVDVSSDDELGVLATSFREMLDEIRKSRAQYEDQKKELAGQVDERTQSLQDKLDELERTKLAILNILEDSDDSYKHLEKTKTQLSETVSQLKEMDKKKDEFLSVTAHELKTPLTSIRGFTELLKNDKVMKNSELRAKYFEIIIEDTKRLEKLITDILDLSRLDLGTLKFYFEAIKVPDLFEDLKILVDLSIRNKGLKGIYRIEKGLAVITADRSRLLQVLSNLVNNAVKYTEKGSVTISAEKRGGSAVFRISDTGVGIPLESQKYLFQRFYQIDSSYTRKVGGSGLGLAICKEITEAMGGKVSLSSAPGKGTSVEISLPIYRR